MTVKGNLSVTVSGGGKGDPQSTLDVTGTHRIHASTAVDILATDDHIRLTVGDSFILIDKNQIILNAGGKAAIVLTDAALIEAKGKGSVLVTDTVLAEGAGKGKVLVSDDVALESSASAMVIVDNKKNVTLDGAKVQVTATTEAFVSGGAGSITADSGGVDVKGPQIKLNG